MDAFRFESRQHLIPSQFKIIHSFIHNSKITHMHTSLQKVCISWKKVWKNLQKVLQTQTLQTSADFWKSLHESAPLCSSHTTSPTIHTSFIQTNYKLATRLSCNQSAVIFVIKGKISSVKCCLRRTSTWPGTSVLGFTVHFLRVPHSIAAPPVTTEQLMSPGYEQTATTAANSKQTWGKQPGD